MIRVITPPAALPVTLAEAREYCRIDPTDASQDNTLTMLIGAAIEYAEHYTGRAFVERVLELNAENFAAGGGPLYGAWPMVIGIELPFPPLLSVDAIAYTDVQGNAQTVDAADYEVDPVSAPGVVRPVWGKAWPPIGYGLNPVRIRYHAGYRPAGSPIDLTDNSYLPSALRNWLAARICTMYDNRGTVIIERATVDQMPREYVDGLLDTLVVGTRFF